MGMGAKRCATMPWRRVARGKTPEKCLVQRSEPSEASEPSEVIISWKFILKCRPRSIWPM